MQRITAAVLACASLAAAQEPERSQVDVLLQDESWAMPPDLLIRARVTALQPAEPGDLRWRHGGEGLGGSVVRGVLGEKLAVGAWSPAVPVASFVKGRFPSQLFVTFMAGNGGKLVRDGESQGYRATEGHSTGVELEFEIGWKGRVLKTFKEKGPDGGSVGIVIPARRLSGGKTPDDPAFLDELEGLLGYARRRLRDMEKLPWAAGPFPRRLAVVSNLNGYGTGSYFGTRYTNREIADTEAKTLRLLGVNGLAHPPRFLLGTSPEGPFGRLYYAQLGGYPVPRHEPDAKKPDPEAGCPFAPGVEARTRQMIEQGLAAALKLPAQEVWWRTEDEIGAVVDRAPEGKGHYAACPRCAEGFRAYLRGLGLSLADVGAADWKDVKPLDTWAKASPDLSAPGAALTAYHSAMFNNYASAKLFTPLREALAKANRERTAPEAPAVYSFALRGNTFLMGGHSLDFFDFYRHADNALVYETSNRDARIWGWDSYLCDVGRVVGADQGIKFGVYVKPHRGAPIQRALSAASRGAEMLYWYTYGPDYAKGDTFAGNPEVMAKVSRAAALLGKTEEVLFGAAWAVPAETAVVNPRSSEIWARLTKASAAAWENAKWTYTALQHAHVPVDAIDEVMLAEKDLSRYKVIYVSGAHLTRAAAARLADWVRAGGTLYTSGGGLARDEANRPLAALEPVLGLKARRPVELWRAVKAYGATALDAFPEAPVPAGAEITGSAPFPTSRLAPAVGREVLDPAEGTEVLARFADGGAAATRRAHGKGRAYVVGFFPGLDYSAAVRAELFDMSRDFDPAWRAYVAAPALERVRPVVDAASPTVEGVLLRHPATGRRAVTLMNWAYRVTAKRVAGRKTSTIKGLVPCRDLVLRIRGVGEVRRAVSTALDRELPVEREGELLKLVLPLLEEGDVLLLE